MKKLLKILLFTLCIPLTFIQAEDQRSIDVRALYCTSRSEYPAQYYLDTYPAPAELQQMVQLETFFGQKKIAEIAHREHGRAYTIHTIPGFYFKPELDRVAGAQILQHIIEQEGYNLLFVPQKYIVGSNNDAWVAAQMVGNICEQPLNKLQIQQLCGLVKKSYFIDTHAGNILPMADGRVALIDTELDGFAHDKKVRIDGLFRMLCSLTMTSEARTFLMQEIERERFRNNYDAHSFEKLHIA